jgi:acyl-CoA synthetase (AMP-forming)/AMP-acid ligase II
MMDVDTAERLAALLAADAELAGPGGAFELEPRVVGGRSVRSFVARKRSLRQYLVDSDGHDRDCVVFDDGRRLTFREFERAVASVASVLRSDHGVGKGDRVCIAGANHLEWLLAFWACQALGAVAVGMNAWWTPTECAHAIELADPALIIADDARLERIGTTSVPVLRMQTDVRVRTEYDGPLADSGATEDDDALILFTSGTTGRPKAAVLTHANAIGYVMLSSYIGARSMFLAGVASDGVARVPPTRLAVFPLFHVSGLLGTAVSGIATGTTTVWPTGRFDPAKVMQLTKREGIKVWGGASTHVIRVLEHPDLETFDVTQIAQVGIGGSASTPELIRRTEERFPHLKDTFSSGYGSTESGGLVSYAPNFLLKHAVDCVGPPLPGIDVRILADDDVDLPEGQEGNIVVRSALVMRGYWRNPAANDEVFLDGGWLRTGDFGRLEDGLLYIASRRRDLILRGGENVYPFEIENRLEEHPSVAEAAVYGVDDTTYGQVVHAAVVVRDGDVVDVDELRRHCAEVLSSYKIPDVFVLRTEPLPRNPTGKVMKHVLGGAAENVFEE